VPILQDEQQRPPSARGNQQVGDCRVQAVALGVLIGGHRLGEVTDDGRQVGQEPGQLACARPEVASQLLGVPRSHKLVERLHHWTVGRAHGRVAGAVQHECTVRGSLVRELTDQAALTRSGLAADQRYAAALVLRAGQDGPQRRHLAWAADECKRRAQPQRPGQSDRCRDGVH
jgi:hypothetical protein